MITVQVPTFDEFNKYEFVEFKTIKIKNKPDNRDWNKITRLLPGFCQGSFGPKTVEHFLKEGKREVRSFYDSRQNSRRFKGWYITIVK